MILVPNLYFWSCVVDLAGSIPLRFLPYFKYLNTSVWYRRYRQQRVTYNCTWISVVSLYKHQSTWLNVVCFKSQVSTLVVYERWYRIQISLNMAGGNSWTELMIVNTSTLTSIACDDTDRIIGDPSHAYVLRKQQIRINYRISRKSF